MAGTNSAWGWRFPGRAVRWGNRDQREAFLQSKSRATHRGLSSSPEDWQPLSLAEHERAMADRRLEMVIDFVQPTDGKATIVIDDAQGRRVATSFQQTH